MSIRNRIVPGALCLLVGTAPLAAQQPAPAPPDPARIALARQFLSLTQPSDSAMSSVMEGMFPTGDMGAMMPAGLMDSIQAQVGRIGPIIQDSTAVLYAQRFTAPELRELIVFYESPLGLKLIREQSAMAGEIMALSQRLMAPIMETMMARMMGGIRPPDEAMRP